MNEADAQEVIESTLLRRVFSAAEKWVQARVVWLMVGSMFANVLIGWSVAGIFSGAQAYEAQSCRVMNTRHQDVLNFWNVTSERRQSHAGHEGAASGKWTTIVNDLRQTNVGNRKLRLDVASVAAMWRELAADDSTDAQQVRDYVRTIEADYDHACGKDTPTPQPR